MGQRLGRAGRAKSNNKDVERMLRQAEALGCRIEAGGSKHYKIKVPGGRGIVIVAGSPSDRLACVQMRNHLRRYGVELAA